jgi:hypothetical protein
MQHEDGITVNMDRLKKGEVKYVVFHPYAPRALC